MPLFSCGINHHLTPIHIRERLSVDSAEIPHVLRELFCQKAVNEAVLVHTCHRTEFYWMGENPSPIHQWFYQKSANLNLYLHQDLGAIKHLLRVSSGLDSMSLGEPQILGQLKQAYKIACECGTVGQHLKRLFPAAFSSAKEIRFKSQISNHPISMAYAAIQIAKRIFSQLSKCTVLVIGAGEMAQLLLTHLKGQGVNQLILANRTLEKAGQLAKFHQAQAIRISEIPQYLTQADIIFTATGSQTPIINKTLTEKMLKSQKRKPILMIDLAVPRNIEPEVGELEDIYLYNVDDLQSILTANLKNRRIAAKQAETLVEWQAVHYMNQLEILNISDLIQNFRQPALAHRDVLLQKSLDDLKGGKTAEEVLKQLAFQLTNKILHRPTQRLREAAYHQQQEVLIAAKKLLTE